MLTSLSRSLRRIFDAAFAKAGPAAQVWADDSSAAPAVCAPVLRLVASQGERVNDRDTAIAVRAPASQPTRGAAAFVAGAGARIYSLEVFRRERSRREASRPAAPRNPQVA